METTASTSCDADLRFAVRALQSVQRRMHVDPLRKVRCASKAGSSHAAYELTECFASSLPARQLRKTPREYCYGQRRAFPGPEFVRFARRPDDSMRRPCATEVSPPSRASSCDRRANSSCPVANDRPERHSDSQRFLRTRMKTNDGYLITGARQCFREETDRPLRTSNYERGYSVLIIRMRIR